MTSTATKANKKTWQRPALQTYGTIGVMTNAVSMTGVNADGGMGMMNKT